MDEYQWCGHKVRRTPGGWTVEVNSQRQGGLCGHKVLMPAEGETLTDGELVDLVLAAQAGHGRVLRRGVLVR